MRLEIYCLLMNCHAGIRERYHSFCDGTTGIAALGIFFLLIFRPFSAPAVLLHFLALRHGILGLKRIRMEQEREARRDCYRKNGHYEVTLREIWEHMEREVDIPTESGMRSEMELEERLCYANPFIQEVFIRLQQRGKRLIVVSDMYLPKEFIRHLLEKNGYAGLENIYVSCEYSASKGNEDLFVLGYCHFIHEYCRNNNVDRIPFLSGDGDIVKQAYDGLYSREDTSYVYWSRAVATKLMAEHNRYDYFCRYLYHKTNRGSTVGQVLASMDLEALEK